MNHQGAALEVLLGQAWRQDGMAGGPVIGDEQWRQVTQVAIAPGGAVLASSLGVVMAACSGGSAVRRSAGTCETRGEGSASAASC